MASLYIYLSKPSYPLPTSMPYWLCLHLANWSGISFFNGPRISKIRNCIHLAQVCTYCRPSKLLGEEIPKRPQVGIDHSTDPLRSNTLIHKQRSIGPANIAAAWDILGFIWLANEFSFFKRGDLFLSLFLCVTFLNNIERFVSVTMATFHIRTARWCLVVARSLV